MKKITNLLDGAAKPIGSLAAIALGLSIISFAAVTIKDNCKILFASSKKKIRAIVCVKKAFKKEEVKPEDKKGSIVKPSVKKPTPKKVVEPKVEGNEAVSAPEVKESK